MYGDIDGDVSQKYSLEWPFVVSTLCVYICGDIYIYIYMVICIYVW
jgi:hypothetical protein